MALKLTEKQESFKNNRIKGMGVSASYKAAYDAKGMNDRTVSIEANKLEQDPRIAPAIEKARKKVADKVLISIEDVVKGLMAETKETSDGSTSPARINAWKALSDYTGGFDNNKTKTEHSGEIHMTHEQWLDDLE